MQTDIFILVILLIAIVVFVGMLAAVAVLFLSKAGTRSESTFRSPARILAALVPQGKAKDASPSDSAVRSALSPALKQRSTWRFGLAILVTLLGLLSLVEFNIWSALHKGWTVSYPGVTFLTVDGRGQVWALQGGSIVLYPAHGEPVQMSLPDLSVGAGEPIIDQIASLAIDQQGQVWAGTLTRRIGIRDGNGQWTLYDPEDIGEPYDGIAILFDSQGQAWTNGPKLSRIKIDTEKKIYTLESSGPTYIQAIATDEKGQLWILNDGELRVLTPDGNWRIYAQVTLDAAQEGFYESFESTRLTIDRQGRAWVGSQSGYLKVLGLDGVWRSYTPADLYPDQAIRATNMVVDEQEKLWGVSGVFGLYRFDLDMGWMAYTSQNSGLSDTYAKTYARDKQGRIWIQTDQALNIFDPTVALPMQYVAAFSALGLILLPAALLSLVLVTIWTIIFMRPGTTRSKSAGELMKFTLVSFSATLCGVYALTQQRILSERIMRVLFGDGWTFSEILIFAVGQPLHFCLTPLSVILGAVIGTFIFRVLVRILRITR